MTSASKWRFRLGFLGWFAAGVAALVGRIEWPTATAVGAGCLAVGSFHRALFVDDEDE